MPPLSRTALYRIEYLILVDPKPAGPLLGYYNDRPIPAAVVDYFGRRYIYAGGDESMIAKHECGLRLATALIESPIRKPTPMMTL